MTKKYTKKIQIVLKEEDYNKIQELAEKEEIPVSIYMRKFVKEWISNA